MERLRQVEAAARERCGLEAMREALAATSAAAESAPMDVGKASVPNLTLTHPHPPSPGSGGGAYQAALEKALGAWVGFLLEQGRISSVPLSQPIIQDNGLVAQTPLVDNGPCPLS